MTPTKLLVGQILIFFMIAIAGDQIGVLLIISSSAVGFIVFGWVRVYDSLAVVAVIGGAS